MAAINQITVGEITYDIGPKNAVVYRGDVNASTGVIVGSNPSKTLTSEAEEVGDMYIVSTAGTIDGINLEVGDSIIFKADCAASTAPTSSYVTFVEKTVDVSIPNPVPTIGTSDTTLATVEGINIKAKLPNDLVSSETISSVGDVTVYVESKIPVIDKTSDSSASFVIDPNKMYMFGNRTTLTINLLPGESGIVNEYMFQFTSGSIATTLNVPNSVVWLKEPDIQTGKKYAVSIENNLGIIGEWSNE